MGWVSLRAAHYSGIKVGNSPENTAEHLVKQMSGTQRNEGGSWMHTLYKNATGIRVLYALGRENDEVAKKAFADVLGLVKRDNTAFSQAGGEEYLAFHLITETMLQKGGEDWKTWFPVVRDKIVSVQNADGSWTGHHCITSRTFCTACRNLGSYITESLFAHFAGVIVMLPRELIAAMEASLTKALAWLLTQQADDGAWHSATYGTLKAGAGLSALTAYSLSRIPKPPSEWQEAMERTARFLAVGFPLRKVLSAPDGTLDYPTYAAGLLLSSGKVFPVLLEQIPREALIQYLLAAQVSTGRGFEKSSSNMADGICWAATTHAELAQAPMFQ